MASTTATLSATPTPTPAGIQRDLDSMYQRNVRCLLVGEDLDLTFGCFSLPIEEYATVEQLQEQVRQTMPESGQQRYGGEFQLFKGFDLYYDKYNSTTDKESTARSKPKAVDSTITDLLKMSTPEKIANKYFQSKYAMRRRNSVRQYLARGRKCDSSRIDFLVSVPKLVLSEDLAELQDAETEAEDEEEGTGIEFGDAASESSETASVISTASTPTKRKRDPVLDEATRRSTPSPSKWQRAPCGRVVSVDKLRMRSPCKRCRALSYK